MRRIVSSAALSALLLFLLFSLSFAQVEQTVTATRDANLRAGPGTTYAIVGGVKTGDTLTVVGENAAGDWYELDNGAWIAAFLVKPAPDQESGPPEGSQAAKVTKVVDGDTIDVSINGETYRVRYILINTPERDQLFYAEATAANRHLVMGKTVYLVKDVNETDRYGRLLRYIYLEDGTFVNRELVRQGFAQLATFPPDVAKEAEIRAAQQEAINAGRGPPQEMQRLDGRLYARYMMQFFVLEGEQMVQHGGMFPNRSLTPGTVRVEWESENLPS